MAVITEAAIRELAGIRGEVAPITSCYLDVDGRRLVRHQDIEHELDGVLRDARHRANGPLMRSPNAPHTLPSCPNVEAGGAWPHVWMRKRRLPILDAHRSQTTSSASCLVAVGARERLTSSCAIYNHPSL